MNDLVGVIANLKKFLSFSNEEITLFIKDKRNSLFDLKENRKYIIPDFQREIRWDTDDVAQLIDDLSSGPKYLGNIILSEISDDEYYIIDGQQRITILIMIINAIKIKYNLKLEIISTIPLIIESFPFFNKLLSNNFSNEIISDKEIIETDKLCQLEKYKAIWNYINEDKILNTQKTAESLRNNIYDSTINIILNRSDDISTGISYFIDVNLKGKQLDTESTIKNEE